MALSILIGLQAFNTVCSLLALTCSFLALVFWWGAKNSTHKVQFVPAEKILNQKLAEGIMNPSGDAMSDYMKVFEEEDETAEEDRFSPDPTSYMPNSKSSKGVN